MDTNEDASRPADAKSTEELIVKLQALKVQREKSKITDPIIRALLDWMSPFLLNKLQELGRSFSDNLNLLAAGGIALGLGFGSQMVGSKFWFVTSLILLLLSILVSIVGNFYLTKTLSSVFMVVLDAQSRLHVEKSVDKAYGPMEVPDKISDERDVKVLTSFLEREQRIDEVAKHFSFVNEDKEGKLTKMKALGKSLGVSFRILSVMGIVRISLFVVGLVLLIACLIPSVLASKPAATP